MGNVGFKVINPYHKNIPITIRQLATHTSSINDEGNYNKAYIFEEELDKKEFPEAWGKYIDMYNKNTPMEMKDFLEKVFKEGGDWETKKNFIEAKPGTKYEYSNIGASLLAYCTQLSVGKNYMDFTKELILEPLKMENSGWSLKEVDSKNHISYYNEIYNIVLPYYCVTYPDGNLYSSVHDLTKFMQEMMKGYEGNSSMLTAESFQEMMKNQIPELDVPTGIIWDMDNTCSIGHGGNDFGIATMMFFDPDTGIGKILFTNVSTEKEEQEQQFYSIFVNIFKYDSGIK
ncbi:MAG: CubicO group peptidase (beta-lactamase class C family) [Flammeovirgaceae bacterium]